MHVPTDDDFLTMYLRPCKYYPKSAFDRVSGIVDHESWLLIFLVEFISSFCFPLSFLADSYILQIEAEARQLVWGSISKLGASCVRTGIGQTDSSERSQWFTYFMDRMWKYVEQIRRILDFFPILTSNYFRQMETIKVFAERSIPSDSSSHCCVDVRANNPNLRRLCYSRFQWIIIESYHAIHTIVRSISPHLGSGKR